MAIEIERKFLVVGEQWRVGPGTSLVQGYLNRDPERTVRVRIAGLEAFITIKGRSQGAMRSEFEYPIPTMDAQSLLQLCDGPLVEKLRYRVAVGGLTWDVDEFRGQNAGLVLAEIELSAIDQPFERPVWVGEEVTLDARYFNSNLAVRPYSAWRSGAT
jgi:CYTH domain-containing protein